MTSPLSVALLGATLTTLLVAVVIAWLRGLPDRGYGVTGWAIAFALFALGYAVALLGRGFAPGALAASLVLLTLAAAVALFCGTRAFLRLHCGPALPASILALAGLGAALSGLFGIGHGVLLWSALGVTVGLLLASARDCLRTRPPEARSGHRLTAAVLGLLAAYQILNAAVFGPGGLSVPGVLTGQILLLALAPGMANVVHQRSYGRLRRAERRLSHAIEALDQGFALYDADDRLVLANEAYRAMFPLIRDRILPGVTYTELLECSARAGQVVSAAGREQEWIRERLGTHRQPDYAREEQLASGRWLYMVERRTPDGETVSLRIDITDIKRRSQQVVDSEARYRDLIEGSIQGIIIDHDWRMIFANRAAAEMLGFGTPAELLGHESLRRLVEAHEVERMQGYQIAREAGEAAPSTYEADMRRADGHTIHVQWMVRNIRWRGELVTQSTLVDITERKQAEQALRDQQDRLEETVRARTVELETANEELEAFTYSVSHDLAAPLRHVRGFARALAEDYGQCLDSTGADYLERVLVAAQRMQQLTDDLLSLSRLTQTELRRERVDLSALAGEVVDQLGAEVEESREVRVEIEPDMTAEGDPRLLRIVLDNLFANAWKYTAREPSAIIRFRRREVEGVVWYVVEDNGVGFDMAYGERLFGPFQRLHNEEHFPGVGVGLATVARIVHRHGGQVDARGRPGVGAAISFTLQTVRRPGETGRAVTRDAGDAR